MKRNSIFKAILAIVALSFGAISAQASSDTSKVCTGQRVNLKGPTATLPIVYSYAWFDQTGTAPIGTQDTLPILANVLTNETGAPVQHIYKLVVTQTGGASCPSDTFYKSIIVYPNLINTVASDQPFYCTGTPVDINLTATTKAGDNIAPTTLTLTSGIYGVLTYVWTGAGVTPSATNTTSIPAAQIASLNIGSSNPYGATASYLDALSVGTTITACHSSAGTNNITITTAPAVNSSNVSTSYQ